MVSWVLWEKIFKAIRTDEQMYGSTHTVIRVHTCGSCNKAVSHNSGQS